MPKAKQVETKAPEETRSAVLGYLGLIASNDVLTGSPSVVGVPAGLTISTIAYNTAAVTVNGVSHGTSQAIQCRIAGGFPGRTYTVRALAPTTNLGDANVVLEGSLEVVATAGYMYGEGAPSVGSATAVGAGTFTP